MFFRVSKGVKSIAQHMIDYPRDWEQCEYYFVNLSIKNKNIKVRTHKGISDIELYGNTTLNAREKRYLADAIKQSIANRLMASVDDAVADDVIDAFRNAG